MTKSCCGDKLHKQFKKQTVEAGIKMMMPSQRACDAENQVRNKSLNGPLRVWSKAGETAEYSATLKADVTCRGYVCILLSARVKRESRWHRGFLMIRP